MKRPYEVTTVLRILTNEDETQAALDQVARYIEAGDPPFGKINKIDRTTLGRRKLAYEIDKQRDGLYVIFYADIEPSHITELELNLKLFNPVLRHLVVRVEDTPTPKAARAKASEAAAAQPAQTETPAGE